MKLKIEFEFLKGYKELVTLKFTPDEEFKERFGVSDWNQVKDILIEDTGFRLCACNSFSTSFKRNVVYIPCDKCLPIQPNGATYLYNALECIKIFSRYDFIEIVNNLASEPLEFDLKERSGIKKCSSI